MFEFADDDLLPKACPYCGEELSGERQATNAVYCDRPCAQKGSLVLRALREGASPSFIGGSAELQVIRDPRAKGFEVFRSVYPYAPCDLIMLRKGRPRLWKVEVKTTGFDAQGHVREGQCWLPSDSDLRAFVVLDVAVRYEPSLDVLLNN
jgi:hypothetical protein